MSKPDFLAEGLVIFGDNAYSNGDFMVNYLDHVYLSTSPLSLLYFSLDTQ